MADEEKEQELEEEQDSTDMAEFEAVAPASTNNKDVWLFLIIIDVVLLCVFGFFLYKNLSAKLFAPTIQPAPTLTVEETIVVEDETAAAGEPVKKEPSIAAMPVEEVAAPSTVMELVKEAAKEEAKAEVKTPAAEKAAPAPKPVTAEKKESVLVKINPKSKYRQVTFRYFGNAKEAAVVSGFTMSKPRAMTQKNGVWETTLAIAPGTYKYLFVIDGKQQPDPYAEQKDGRSVLVVK
ncbi:MAG: hypothetical protein J6U96_05930 [Elusimicrobiaceae bacterium]|nr:hypothetical protein [Elusimicrobiaceae bacterium]